MLDDVERLLGHVTLTGRGGRGGEAEAAAAEAEGALQLSPPILEALLAHLRRPPAAGRQLMVIGVTAVKGMLARTALLGAFDAVVALPPLQAEAPPTVARLLWLCGAAREDSDELAALAAKVPVRWSLRLESQASADQRA